MTTDPVTYCSTKGPDVCWRPPLQVKHGFRTPEDCCPNYVPFFRISVWIHTIGIATVSQLYFAEPSWAVTVIDENIIRFDIYSLVSISYGKSIQLKRPCTVPVCT